MNPEIFLWIWLGGAVLTLLASWACIGFIVATDDPNDLDSLDGAQWVGVSIVAAIGSATWPVLAACMLLVGLFALPYQVGRHFAERAGHRGAEAARKRADQIEHLRELRDAFERDSLAWRQLDDMIKDPSFTP